MGNVQRLFVNLMFKSDAFLGDIRHTNLSVSYLWTSRIHFIAQHTLNLLFFCLCLLSS